MNHMTIEVQTQQFLSGLQNVEREIIEKVRALGNQNFTANNFLWHRGKKLVPIPTVVELEIKLNDKSTNAVFDRSHMSDSWERLIPQVSAIVGQLVSDLTG